MVRKICCIGANYIGGPISSVIALKCSKIEVKVLDQNEDKIRQWNSGKLPIYLPCLDEVVRKCRGKNLFFTSDMTTPIKEADIIFICVDTPMKIQEPGGGKVVDLKFLEDAARIIANTAEPPKIIVEKTTVPIRAAETISTILNANLSESDSTYQVLSNPEFLSEGTGIQDLLNPERILIGGDKTPEAEAAIEALIAVYEQWVPRTNIMTADAWSSELSKLATSAFLAQRMSSINSLCELCEVTNADISEVANAIGMDSRIGSKYLEASLGFGGPTLPKDIFNVVYLCESLDLPHAATYWQKVLDINEYQKRRFAKKVIESFFNTLTEKLIAILGFSFKKDTGITKDSPAIYICATLLEEGARLCIYDPVVPRDQIMEELINSRNKKDVDLENLVNVWDDPYEATRGAHGVIVCTDWDEFKSLDFYRIYHEMVKPAYIFDGRKMLPHRELMEIGYNVYTVGKNIRSSSMSFHSY